MPTARSLPELLEYHQRSVVALRVLRVDALNLNDRSRFPKGAEAVDEVLTAMRDELDDEVVLAVIASGERVLRLDAIARAAAGGGATAAGRLAILSTKFDGSIPLEDIVDVWKIVARAPHEGGAFKQMYTYRHGLAHGRYFNKSGLHHVRPDDAADVLVEFFKKIKAAEPDFPLA